MSTFERFRQIAFAEAISYLVLLFIAMPLKYGLGWELAVKVVGWAHGALFMAYGAWLILCWQRYGWLAGGLISGGLPRSAGTISLSGDYSFWSISLLQLPGSWHNQSKS